MDSHKFTNSLIKEDSLYLLQHAHNPVNWLPWGEEAQKKARNENKLMLISIGYSSCHWCHVMEKECFEDEEVAELMNEHFICIKVDREERPDVDQIYMEAVQLMTRQGGWPLNCFTNPKGEPVFGGTYFPKNQWMNVMLQLTEIWKNEPEKFNDYGAKLKEGLQVNGILPKISLDEEWSIATLNSCVNNWKDRFDKERGGPNKAPKFPLPSNYAFLLRYSFAVNNEEVKEHVKLTLDRMATGGIVDQIGGGFTRYSTDGEWKVPHFEKMLYDNGQLLALYSEAYLAFNDPEYLHTAEGIKKWLRREMQNGEGGYYSALDADSEGVEGKYYVWDQVELTVEYPEFENFYHLDYKAEWEGNIIPVRRGTLSDLANQNGAAISDVKNQLEELNGRLIAERNKRIRPGTDDKSLCSWNAMLASGFAKSYRFTGDEKDLEEAIAIIGFIEKHLIDPTNSTLKHTWKNGVAKIEGFLEDYAFLIEAYIQLYLANFNEEFAEKAKGLSYVALDKFYDSEKGLFFFTPISNEELISRPTEISDNVIPSSNSVMANNLSLLSELYAIPHFEKVSKRLLKAIEKSMIEYGSGYSEWASIWLRQSLGNPEMAIAGEKAYSSISEMRSIYKPGVLAIAAQSESTIALFQGRFKKGHTRFYVCRNKTCQNPVDTVTEAFSELNRVYEEN